MEPLTPNNTTRTSDTSINIEEQIYLYLKLWKWIALSVVLFLLGAYFYLRYTVPQYGMSATVLIKDDKRGTELDVFSDLGILGGGKSNIENEIAILQSRTLSQNVVRQLDFNITYFVEGRILSPEVYKNRPIHLLFINKNDAFYKADTTFIIKPVSERKFEMSGVNGTKPRQFAFGQEISNRLGTFMVVNKSASAGHEITVRIRSVEGTAASYSSRLSVEQVGKKTNIVKLSLSDPIMEKGIDYVNAIIEQYNADAIEDKNSIARKTSQFVESRLSLITEELDSVEKGAESF